MGEWAVLANDTSISMDFTSPVFNDNGDYSYPFKLPIAQNVHILKNIADPNGVVSLKNIHKQSAEIWLDGFQITAGIIEVSDSIDFSSGYMEININSQTGKFNELIDDLSCRNVPLREKILLGRKARKVHMSGGTLNRDDDGNVRVFDKTVVIDLPSFNCKYFKHNIELPYPDAYYCNIDICCPAEEKEGYALLPYYRLDTSPCFYVLYFLDCLFSYLDINFDNSAILTDNNRDLRRLAFVNFKAQFEEDKDNIIEIPYKSTKVVCDNPKGYFYPFELTAEEWCRWWIKYGTPLGDKKRKYFTQKISRKNIETVETVYCYANSNNFPDQQVSDIIKDLSNAFGLKFLFDYTANTVRAFLLKDVFNDTETINMECDVLSSPCVTRVISYGTIVTYGDSDDTQYSYTMPDGTNSAEYTTEEQKKISNGIIYHRNYASILSMPRVKTDTNTHYDLTTGNAYRIKVNKDTGDAPQLFEVAAYAPYKQNVTDEDKAEKIQIKFKPVVVNDIYEFVNDTKENPETRQILNVYTSSNMYAKQAETVLYNSSDKKTKETALLPSFSGVLIDDTYTPEKKYSSDSDYHATANIKLTGYNISSDLSALETPVETTSEYLLGFMRGSRNLYSNFSVVNDYDREGNMSWKMNAQESAFTADSIDNFGNQYDYDSNYENRLSLKLDARKVKKYDEEGNPEYYDINSELADRGLVQRFLSEYLYFKEHMVKVTFEVVIGVVELLNINYLKKYKIGNYIGFINKVSFSISNEGISNCKIEMYCLNK